MARKALSAGEPVLCLAIAISLATPLFAQGAEHRRVSQSASNIDQGDTRSVIAPALPIPALLPSDPPRIFLLVAREAVAAGRTGAAQEALERAETRILDRPDNAADVPADADAVRDIGNAREALARDDRDGALRAIDDALEASRVVRSPPFTVDLEAVSRTPAVLPSPLSLPSATPVPVQTYAARAGHWKLDGARYVWVPPETTLHRVEVTSVVPGAFVWSDGAYVWEAAHDAPK